MDLIMDMEADLEGHCYLLVIVDYFSKRVEVLPTQIKGSRGDSCNGVLGNLSTLQQNYAGFRLMWGVSGKVTSSSCHIYWK